MWLGRYSVWQWTDEFCDRHSCVSLVRGGSNYAHSPAGYYFPRPSSLATHNTWLMLSESMDRKGTFGFRCVVDAVSPAVSIVGSIGPYWLRFTYVTPVLITKLRMDTARTGAAPLLPVAAVRPRGGPPG
eukprot:COSAG01_NODE_15108_length_1373_cov_1.052590_1_plen_128_part_10